MRVLMVLHMPWDRRLGAPSVQIEIADRMRAAGHEVEHLCSTDVLDGHSGRSRSVLRPVSFAERALPALMRRAASFDVIDAHQGNILVDKDRLGFDGLLVTRSSGLVPFYVAYEREARARWPEPNLRGSIGRAYRRHLDRRRLADAAESFRSADIINVPNVEEQRWLADNGYGAKAICIPNGVPDDLLAATIPRGEVDVEVAILATWDLRKGMKDWPEIIDTVRASVPHARFLFAGTGRCAADVAAVLGDKRMEGVRVEPTYERADLPSLLSKTRVGALASYVEGFGMGLVEQMALGIPVVAYDVPGPRQTVGPLGPGHLVAKGRAADFGRALVAVLTADEPSYVRMREAARASAGRFRWSDIARQTATAYETALSRIK